MGRAHLGRLVAAFLAFCTPALSQDCRWDLRRDFRGQEFPDGWRYQRAQPGMNDYVDLEWTVLPESPDLPPGASGWTDPLGKDESWLAVGLEEATIYPLPQSAVFCHPNAGGRRQDWSWTADVVITWTAPGDGVVDLGGFVGHADGCRPGTDGVTWTVYVNYEMESPLFETTTVARAEPFSIANVKVETGDVVRFRENSGKGDGCDHGHLSACVSFSALLFRRGDGNNDGRVNIADALHTLNWLFGDGAAPGCAAASNINGAEGVNISDATYLLNYLFASGAAPVEPFPECGFLPEDETLPCEIPSADCQEP